MSYPDVITAADIQDEMSLIYRSMFDYINLCLKTCARKPNINILLSKTDFSYNDKGEPNYKVSLISFSAIKELGFIEKEFEKQKMYFKSQVIETNNLKSKL